MAIAVDCCACVGSTAVKKMSRGKPHGEEIKAQVMAALLAGQGVCEIADAYSLPESSVRNWKKEISPETLSEISTRKGERIEQLLYDYLTQLLSTLKKQAEVVSEPDYIRKQDADALAVLHGVMADKGIKLLEAAERAKAVQPKQLSE